MLRTHSGGARAASFGSCARAARRRTRSSPRIRPARLPFAFLSRLPRSAGLAARPWRSGLRLRSGLLAQAVGGRCRLRSKYGYCLWSCTRTHDPSVLSVRWIFAGLAPLALPPNLAGKSGLKVSLHSAPPHP
eukprot:2980317-Prymnesium_polylepis.2